MTQDVVNIASICQIDICDRRSRCLSAMDANSKIVDAIMDAIQILGGYTIDAIRDFSMCAKLRLFGNFSFVSIFASINRRITRWMQKNAIIATI